MRKVLFSLASQSAKKKALVAASLCPLSAADHWMVSGTLFSFNATESSMVDVFFMLFFFRCLITLKDFKVGRML